MIKLQTPSLQSLADKWNALAKRRGEINGNNKLSIVGKRELLQQLEAERDQLRKSTLSAVQAADAALKTSYMSNQKARGVALEKSHQRFESLESFMASEEKRARVFIQTLDGDSLMREWEAVRNSEAASVAWSNAFAGAPASDKSNEVRVDVKQRYQAVVYSTPEFVQAETKGREIATRGQNLKDDIIVLINSSEWGGGFGTETAEMQRVMSRLDVTRTFEGEGEIVNFRYLDQPELAVDASGFGS